jgi:hypothetical protein
MENSMINQSAVQNEVWVPLLDYAVLYGMSTSTIRRYIKAKKIEFKIEKGRYLLRNDSDKNKQATQKFAAHASPVAVNWNNQNVTESMSVYSKVSDLEQKLSKANEQIAELKMLIAIYEEKLAQKA